MLKQHNMGALFEEFIRLSRKGKRVKKNGQRIHLATINNYSNTLRLLRGYSEKIKRPLILYELKGNNKREFCRAKMFYGRLYSGFCTYLFTKGAANNYIGQSIKIIRTFFNWCNQEMGINTGFFFKNFYVLKEEVPILTLSLEQLGFLIHDQHFQRRLSPMLEKAKDVFVFGCSTGLRIGDLRMLRQRDILHRDGHVYLGCRARKTGMETLIKLPPYCIDIINKYSTRPGRRLLPVTINSRFNERIKTIGELAGWTWTTAKFRMSGNKRLEIKKNNRSCRFCDLLSSHTMRRTCITSMLCVGMPEYIVRKISGHTSNSRSFFRYVELAQKLMDEEINKLFSKLTDKNLD